MSEDPRGLPGRIERLDEASLEARLRHAAKLLAPDRVMDDLEVRHLIRVITACPSWVTDVYSEERIARIMLPDRRMMDGLIERLVRQTDRDDGDAVSRARRLPDDVRVVGDKALFDLGLFGRRSVKGYDLEELGTRAYRLAGELLELLAADRRLRDFFKQNRLLMLPLEEEVVFLRQCSQEFRHYAEIIKSTGNVEQSGEEIRDLAASVPLMAAAAAAIAAEEPECPAGQPSDGENPYMDAAASTPEGEAPSSRDQLISCYERILLFSSLDMEQLRAALEAIIVDQPQAVRKLCDEFSLFAAGTRDPRKPPGYFLVGPTGVGKNHLVESLTRLLEGVWNTEVPTLMIEGPNYTYPSDINELRGATRGFIRSDEEGLLTSFHEKSSRAPFSVILIDEVEKAHRQLITFFL